MVGDAAPAQQAPHARPPSGSAARTSSTERLRASRSGSTCADRAERQRAHSVRWASTDQSDRVRTSRRHSRPAGLRPRASRHRPPVRPVGTWARHGVPQACRRCAVVSGPACCSASAARSATPGPVAAGLDGPFRDAQQHGRLRAGQAVQHGRLDGGAQLRGQVGQGLAQAAVLDADQHLILGRDDHLPAFRSPATAAAAGRRSPGGSRRSGGGRRCPR